MNNKIKDAFRNNTYTVILFGLLIAVLALFSALKGAAFWQVNLWKGMTMQFPEYACVALGLMFVFVSGHHDMSQVLLGNFASILAVNYMAAHVVDGMTNGQVGGVILVANSMLLVGIDTYWKDFFNGIIILVGVTLSAVQAMRKQH